MKIFILFVYILVFFAGCAKKEDADVSVFDLRLATLDQQEFALNELKNHEASVIIFLQPECPFCNSYGKTLRNLDSIFNSQQVTTIAVVAGKNYPANEIIAYRDKYQLKFPFLLDPEFVLTRKLKASITPQAFLIDKNGAVIYHGMIDNWGYEIGKARARATEYYLSNAVNRFLSGNREPVDSTKAVGCYIQ